MSNVEVPDCPACHDPKREIDTQVWFYKRLVHCTCKACGYEWPGSWTAKNGEIIISIRPAQPEQTERDQKMYVQYHKTNKRRVPE